MYQVAAPVWNRIAATVPLKHPWAALFRLAQEELGLALDEQAQRLTSSGHSPRVIRAYQTVAPLLATNEAINLYFEKTGDLQIRQALPEVTTPQEAVELATEEFRLDLSEQKELLLLLKDLAPDD